MVSTSKPTESTTPPFSATTRALHWRALAREPFDLLVIGGGITGAGIARDAACRGLRVALVEAGDFGRGTSSRSSRLIHGGLRYLETLDFGLVFEALGERTRLLELAPHLVRPLEFLFPVYRGDEVGRFKLRAGMWLYDALALFRGIERHRMLGDDAVLRREPELRRTDLQAAALYYDAQVDDARLTLAVARAAHEAGARPVSYAEVFGFVRDSSGAVSGARVRDRISGEECEVSARLVISATGPWTDEVRRMADASARPRLRPTKGVHILLDRERVGNRGAIIFRSAVDRRVMFVLPWGEFTYIGTTDTDYDPATDELRATRADVDYLLASANALFPAARLAPEDVISTWAGVRPLLAPATERSRATESQTSREHEIWREPSGLLCVAGGKLTTFRTMAKEAVDLAARLLKERGVPSGDCMTEYLPLPGAPVEKWTTFRERILGHARALGIPLTVADHLAHAYGTEAETVLERVARNPEQGEAIVEGHPYIWAEISHAVQCEMATSLEDVLRRRLHLLYEAHDGGRGVAHAVAERMAKEPGLQWSEAETSHQVERYQATAAATRTSGAR